MSDSRASAVGHGGHPFEPSDQFVRVPKALSRRWLQFVEDAGGSEEALRRLIIMAPRPPRRLSPAAAIRGAERLDVQVTVSFSKPDLAAVDAAARSAGMKRGGWLRSLALARLQRGCQLAPEELRANSAVRYQLQRIVAILREIAKRSAMDGLPPAEHRKLVDAYEDARRQLSALRAAMAGVHLYWEAGDDGL
ncbi:hypothetical protein P7B02_06710 [Caulobacter segnis]|uniref:hypothetical protein n=1 Tax=Caulobacter segnis TaxID=88688 RepID=UPI00240F6D70|nr:hypothetical protein [Caulobacter segnis]MDG2521229.1 hypothetical protein [Caulobacter segnis]